jgi:tetratricopeptide (TPR) repeat protein
VATLAVAYSSAVPAQTLTGAARWADSAQKEINAAAVANDAARLAAARVILDRALAAFPDDALLLHYQGYALYRQLNMTPNASPAETARIAHSAEDYLQKSISKKPMAESFSLLTAIYGREIGADPSLGMTLGQEIGSAAATATATGPGNPRVFLVAGQGALFTPTEYGGGAALAERSLLQAVALFEKDRPNAPLPSWGRGEAYAWLGQVYEKLGRKADAMAAYKKALEIEPGYSWVKHVLIPALEKGGG